jgi:uncharacterized membrane protein YkoI
MRRPSPAIAGLGLGLGLIVATPTAFAQTSPANPAQTLTRPAKAAEHQSQAELRRFSQASLSLTQAISKGEEYSHGSAIEAGFAIENGQPVYRVKTVGKEGLWQGWIDADKGSLVGAPRSTPQAQLDAKQKAQLAQLQKEPITLAQAINSAEQKSGGKAIDAALTDRDGKLAYDTEVARNGTLEMLTVDARQGKVVASQAVPTSGGTAGSGGTSPPAPSATLPRGASTDKSLGEPPPGSTQQHPPITR